MDYEVFPALARPGGVGRGASNTDTVAAGVQKTGTIITRAALLLGVVIGAFGTSGMVPRLLGDRNRWAPGPLRRWWERHGHREEPRERPRDEPREQELV